MWKMLTSSLKPEVHRATEDGNKRLWGKSEVLTDWEFSVQTHVSTWKCLRSSYWALGHVGRFRLWYWMQNSLEGNVRWLQGGGLKLKRLQEKKSHKSNCLNISLGRLEKNCVSMSSAWPQLLHNLLFIVTLHAQPATSVYVLAPSVPLKQSNRGFCWKKLSGPAKTERNNSSPSKYETLVNFLCQFIKSNETNGNFWVQLYLIQV